MASRGDGVITLIDTQCASCHQISGKGAHASIVTPVTGSSSFEHARFDHALHLTIACQSCHAKGASNMLMPSRDKCEQCHAARTTSSCVTCHDDHKPLK